MKTIPWVLLMGIITAHALFGETFNEKVEKWAVKSRAFIAVSRKLPDEEAIPALSVILMKSSRNIKCLDSDELPGRNLQRDVINEASQVLRTIPGHAEFQRSKILAAIGAFNESKTPGEKYDAARHLDEVRSQSSEYILSRVPSPETVRVLGEFLNGKFTVDEFSAPQWHWQSSPMSGWAANSLAGLGFTSGNPGYGGKETVAAWKTWYEEVKSGRRTFSFEGDPQEYDLTGPVREARNSETPRAVKRPGLGQETNKDARIQQTNSPLPWIVAGLIALLGLGGYVFRRKGRPV